MTEETLFTHAIPIDPLTGAISVPIYQTSTFVQDGPGILKGFDYTQTNNPKHQVLETLIAQLEHGHAGFAFASGLPAIIAEQKTSSECNPNAHRLENGFKTLISAASPKLFKI